MRSNPPLLPLLRWQLHDRRRRFASAAGCAAVHRGKRADGRSVAIKVSYSTKKSLEREAAVLRALDGVAGFPALLHHRPVPARSTVDDEEMLVMELLGPSLETLWQANSSRFAPHTVLRAGRSILRCLRRLHHAGYVHNDLKPANVCLGAPGTACAHELHLIDFDQATPIVRDSVVCLGAGRTPRAGTGLYASIQAHERTPARPVHDLESLVYMLAFWASGGLPWQHAAQHTAYQFEPTSLVASIKREVMFDGCDGLSESCLIECELDERGCEASQLIEAVDAPAVADALRALWSHVVACQQPGEDIDYDACLDACGGGADEVEGEPPFAGWEIPSC